MIGDFLLNKSYSIWFIHFRFFFLFKEIAFKIVLYIGKINKSDESQFVERFYITLRKNTFKPNFVTNNTYYSEGRGYGVWKWRRAAKERVRVRAGRVTTSYGTKLCRGSRRRTRRRFWSTCWERRGRSWIWSTPLCPLPREVLAWPPISASLPFTMPNPTPSPSSPPVPISL